jgi:hypothetical protein
MTAQSIKRRSQPGKRSGKQSRPAKKIVALPPPQAAKHPQTTRRSKIQKPLIRHLVKTDRIKTRHPDTTKLLPQSLRPPAGKRPIRNRPQHDSLHPGCTLLGPTTKKLPVNPQRQPHQDILILIQFGHNRNLAAQSKESKPFRNQTAKYGD